MFLLDYLTFGRSDLLTNNDIVGPLGQCIVDCDVLLFVKENTKKNI